MIHGVTDRPRYFPRIGKIRLGVRDSQRGYPKDTDHFVLTDAPDVAEVYGKTPKKLVITFPSNDIEEVFPTRLENWRSRKAQAGDATQRSVLFCSGDGRTANRIYIGSERDPQGHAAVQAMPKEDQPDIMEMFEMVCPHQECPYFEDRSCKPVGRLTFVLPEVSFGGVYQIETSSMFGFGNILDTLKWVKALSQSPAFPDGRLVGAFFELSREPQSMTVPGTGKVTIKHVLALKVITQPKQIAGLQGRVPPWLLAGPGMKQLQPAQQERPEDHFPEGVMKTVEAEKPSEDMLALQKMSGMGKAEFDVVCAQLGGDIDKIKAHIQGLMDKDIEEAFPTTVYVGANVPAPEKEAPKPAEPEKDVLSGW